MYVHVQQHRCLCPEYVVCTVFVAPSFASTQLRAFAQTEEVHLHSAIVAMSLRACNAADYALHGAYQAKSCIEHQSPWRYRRFRAGCSREEDNLSKCSQVASP